MKPIKLLPILVVIFLSITSALYSQNTSRDLFFDTVAPPLHSVCIEEEEGMVFAEPGCKFFVRLYTHVIEDSTYQMVWDSSEVLAIVNDIQSDFNPHGIYFVWDSTRYLIDYEYYDTPDPFNYQSGHNDGIDLYLFNNHLSPYAKGGGAAYYKGDGSGFAVTYGNYPFDTINASIPDSKVNSHELGHVLGLLHTDNCFATFPPSSHKEDSTNCATAGDYVCDTGPDGNYNYTINGDSCNSSISYADMTNIMSKTTPDCMTHFTPGQGGRMRYFLSHIWELTNFLVQPASTNITTNTTWSTNMHLLSDVNISNNSVLTITSEIYIAESVKIVIEPGSKLVVDGGKLGNMCSGFWQGIEVWGDADEHQYPVAGSYLQGTLVLKNNAVIEYAKEAIRLHNPEDGYGGQATSGGIVQASNSTIRNVFRGAEFLAYQNYNPSNTSQIRDNRSYFINCDFELTQQFPDTINPYAFITMWGVKGVSITGCTFKNTRTDSTSTHPAYGRGIYCIDAGFKVLPRCDTLVIGSCPAAHLDSNRFENLRVGIWAIGGSTNTYTYVVNRSVFKNCIAGIISDGVSNMLITENSFTIGGHPGAGGHNNQWGISLQNGISGFKVEGNSFVEAANVTSDPYTTAGVWTNNTGIANNNVFRNSFDGLYRGVQATGINKFNDVQFYTPGLKYECNEFTGLEYDIFIPKPATVVSAGYSGYYGIKTYQGNGVLPAGNGFSNNDDLREADLYNRVPNFLRYYYYDSNPTEYPDSVSPNVTRTANTDENTCEPSYSGTGATWRLNGEEWSELISDYSTYFEEYDGKLAELLGSVDGGSTATLISTINGADPADSSTLYSLLMGYSPWLSEASLYAAANREDVLAGHLLFDILASNPGGLRNDWLIEYMGEKDDSLDQWMLDSLYISREVSTDETEHTAEVNYWGELLTQTLDGMVGHVLSDTNGTDHEDLLEYLEFYQNPQAMYLAINSLVETGSYESALDLMDDIALGFGLTEAAGAGHDNLDTYLDFMMGIYTDSRNMAGLSGEEVDDLEYIASLSDDYMGSSRAKNVLNFFYGYEYWDEPVFDTVNDPKMAPAHFDDELQTADKLIVYPNPANAFVLFDYAFENISHQPEILVYDMLGRLKTAKPLPSNTGIYRLNLEEWTHGIYVFIIRDGDNLLKRGKFIVE